MPPRTLWLGMAPVTTKNLSEHATVIQSQCAQILAYLDEHPGQAYPHHLLRNWLEIVEQFSSDVLQSVAEDGEEKVEGPPKKRPEAASGDYNRQLVSPLSRSVSEQSHDGERVRRPPPPYQEDGNKTVAELRAVRIRVSNPMMIEVLRRKDPGAIKYTVLRALERTGVGARVRIAAASQLPSGDLELWLATVEERDDLARNAQPILNILGGGAEVVHPAYGVIVHDIPTADIKMGDSDRQKTMAQFELDNRQWIPGMQITSIGWLATPKRPRGSIIVNFSNCHHANEAINRGLRFHGQIHDTELYDAGSTLLQCSVCLKYGHTESHCRAQPRCETCAGHHRSIHCTANPFGPSKCALCGGAHQASAAVCEVRIRELRRIEERRANPPTRYLGRPDSPEWTMDTRTAAMPTGPRKVEESMMPGDRADPDRRPREADQEARECDRHAARLITEPKLPNEGRETSPERAKREGGRAPTRAARRTGQSLPPKPKPHAHPASNTNESTASAASLPDPGTPDNRDKRRPPHAGPETVPTQANAGNGAAPAKRPSGDANGAEDDHPRKKAKPDARVTFQEPQDRERTHYHGFIAAGANVQVAETGPALDEQLRLFWDQQMHGKRQQLKQINELIAHKRNKYEATPTTDPRLLADRKVNTAKREADRRKLLDLIIREETSWNRLSREEKRNQMLQSWSLEAELS